MNITLPRAVIEQALEALEAMNPYPASKEDQRNKAITALRTALEQPEQEPVAWAGVDFSIDCTPPQRKPLSDDEIQAIWKKTFEFGSSPNTFARAIEAAHNIKE